MSVRRGTNTGLPIITTFQAKKRKALFQNIEHADVIFKCPDPQNKSGSAKDVYAHKIILATASDVFDTMFYGSLPEGRKVNEEKKVIEVPVPDVEASIFLLLLKAIYGLEVNIEDIEATKLLYAAHKYDCKDVIEMVEKYLIQSVNPKNVLSIYEHSHLHHCRSLKAICLKLISANTHEILESPDIFLAKPETITAIFQLDYLNIESEYRLVVILQRYIKVRQAEDPQIEQKMRPAVNAIRFLTLAEWEISTTVLLTDTEIAAIRFYLRTGGKSKLPNGLSENREKRQNGLSENREKRQKTIEQHLEFYWTPKKHHPKRGYPANSDDYY